MEANQSIPTYLQFIDSSTNFVLTNYRWLRNNYYFPSDTISDFKLCWSQTNTDYILIVIVLAVLWTIARYVSAEFAFKPFARLCGMSKKDVQKYPESAWKFLFYLSTFSASVYIIFGKQCCPYFDNPSMAWINYSMNDVIPQDISILYILEVSFYIHSIYAVLFLDEWRKDSLVMFIHHIITVSLLSLSFMTKAHRIGVLVILLHDGCDVIMEGTKCLLNYKSIGGLCAKIMDVLSAIGYISFLIFWFVCRLYWFPLKALYSSSEYFTHNQIKFPFMVVLYFMLWIIQAMNIYWFSFIVMLFVNIVTGRMSELEDNREYSQTTTSENKILLQNNRNDERNGVKNRKKVK